MVVSSEEGCIVSVVVILRALAIFANVSAVRPGSPSVLWYTQNESAGKRREVMVIAGARLAVQQACVENGVSVIAV